jgi:hypothetical protein
MSCGKGERRGRNGQHVRADVAARELADVMSAIEYDDSDLIAAVEAALRRSDRPAI